MDSILTWILGFAQLMGRNFENLFDNRLFFKTKSRYIRNYGL